MAKSISEHSFKLTSNSIGFTGELSKVQKSLGLLRNENGLLVNSQGKLVEGLSNAKIGLGQYLDENGRLYDSQGRIIDGLSATKVALGMYKDELGNVYNRQGQLISQSPVIIAKEAEKAAAFANANNQLRSGASAVMQLTGLLTGLGNEGGKATKTMFVLSSGVTAFASASKVIPAIAKGITSINATLATTASLTAFIKGMSGDIIGLVAGGVAAAGVMVWASQVDTMGNSAQSASTKVNGLTDSLSRLQQEAAKFQNATWNIAEFGRVVNSLSVSTDTQMLGLLDNLEASIADRTSRLSRLEQHQINLKNSLLKDGVNKEVIQRQLQDVEQRIEKVRNEGDAGLSDWLGGVIESAISSNMTEREKMQTRMTALERWIARGRDDDGRATAALGILEQKAATLTDTYQAEQEAQKVLAGTLTGTAVELAKVKKEFAFLGTVSEKEIQASSTLSSAREAYKKRLYELSDKGQAEAKQAAEQKTLKDGITSAYQSSLSAEAKYTARKEQLTGMLDQAFKQSAQWKAAMEDNRKSLLSGSKFGKFLSDAREEMVPLKTKLSTAFAEIDRVGKELGFTKDEIAAAKKKVQDDIAKGGKVDATKAQDTLVAATRGSVEAFKIINQSSDKTTTAVRDLQRTTAAGLSSVVTAIESAGSQPAANVRVFNGGSV